MNESGSRGDRKSERPKVRKFERLKESKTERPIVRRTEISKDWEEEFDDEFFLRSFFLPDSSPHTKRENQSL